MFEQISPTVRIAKSGTGIGVVTHDDRALLIDLGLDENLARKVVHALANDGVSVAAIVNSDASLRDRALGGPRVLARGALPRPLRVRGPFPRATHAHADHIGAQRVRAGDCGRLGGRVGAVWSEPQDGTVFA